MSQNLLTQAMDNFVAIDVETANCYPSSICAIGAVKVLDGVIADRFYSLVCPEPNWYNRRFSEEIHGIFPEDTDDCEGFGRVWDRIEPFIGRLPLVAHNKAFDERCIRAAFKVYQMDYPDYPFYCTLQQARRTIPRGVIGSYSLPSVCDFFGIPFSNHHNAAADAEACANIAKVIF